jgi:hypothetical protein
MAPPSIESLTNAANHLPLKKIQAFVSIGDNQDVLVLPPTLLDDIQIDSHRLQAAQG